MGRAKVQRNMPSMSKSKLAAHDPRGITVLDWPMTNPREFVISGHERLERTVTMPELGPRNRPFSKRKRELLPLQNLMCLYDAATICKFTLFDG
jgi:hypothetical protein